MLDDYTPTVHANNVSEGMVLQFGGALAAAAANGMSVPLWAAEVTYVEKPDGLGGFGFYVKPEDAEDGLDLYLTADDWKEYPIVG